MQSLLQLLYIILFFYLGIVGVVFYLFLIEFSNKFKFIKAILLFILLSYFYIKVIYRYKIELRFIYGIIYILGIILGKYLFYEEINKLYIKITMIINSVIYLLKLLLIPPLFYKLKCKIITIRFYKKYPYLKPSINKLF